MNIQIVSGAAFTPMAFCAGLADYYNSGRDYSRLVGNRKTVFDLMLAGF